MLSDLQSLTSIPSQLPMSPEQTFATSATSKSDSLSAIGCSLSNVPALANKLSLMFSHEWLISAPLAHDIFSDTYISSISPDTLPLSCLDSSLDFNSFEQLLLTPQTVNCQSPILNDSEKLKENIEPKLLQLLSQSNDEAPYKNNSGSQSRLLNSQLQKQMTLRVRRNAVFVSREYLEQVLSTSCQESNSNDTIDDKHACSSYSDYDSDNGCNVASDVSGKSMVLSSAFLADQTTSKGYNHHINTILYGWLERNRSNPYPTSVDKKWLMDQTGLSKMQLKNWFCNVRRRKLGSSIRRKLPSSR